MASKGSFAVNQKFWIIAILLMMVVLLAVWLLLNESFVDYVLNNINSEERICDTFERVPVLGSIQCPN